MTSGLLHALLSPGCAVQALAPCSAHVFVQLLQQQIHIRLSATCVPTSRPPRRHTIRILLHVLHTQSPSCLMFCTHKPHPASFPAHTITSCFIPCILNSHPASCPVLVFRILLHVLHTQFPSCFIPCTHNPHPASWPAHTIRILLHRLHTQSASCFIACTIRILPHELHYPHPASCPAQFASCFMSCTIRILLTVLHTQSASCLLSCTHNPHPAYCPAHTISSCFIPCTTATLQVAVQLTDTQVDEFCAAATNPAMARAVQTMHKARGAAGTQARMQWQQSVKNHAKEQAKLSASNMRRAGNSSTANTTET
jgi:hypothetical protein